MKRLFASLVLAVLCLVGSDATACMNAVDAEQPAIEAIRQAEAALENGDLHFAVILADEAAEKRPALRLAAASIHAVAVARDPSSTEAQLEAARLLGGTTPKELERGFEIDARLPAYRDSARIGLRSLYDEDLIGSAWAIAALARLEPPAARDALFSTCRLRATEPGRACRAELGTPPRVAFHGNPSTYVVGGGLFVGFLLVLFLRTRERRPWRGHLVRVQVAAGLAGLGIVIGAARSPISAIGAMVVLYLVVLWAERRLFFRAVRRGLVPGLALRAALPEDSELATCEVNGRTREEVLERTPGHDNYRESARGEPIYRIVHRPQKRVFALVGVGIALGLLLAMSMATLRGM